MSSSLKDLQCIAVCKVDASNVIQNKYHSPAEWAGCRVTDSHPPTNEPCRQTFAAHGRPRLSCSGTVTGPGRRKGTTEGGKGDNSQRGRGATPQRTKNSKQGNPATPKAAHKGQVEDNRRIAGRNTNRKTHTEETAREEPRKRLKTNREQGKHRPKHAKPGVQEGDRTTKRRAKDIHKSSASGSRSLSGAKG